MAPVCGTPIREGDLVEFLPVAYSLFPGESKEVFFTFHNYDDLPQGQYRLVANDFVTEFTIE